MRKELTLSEEFDSVYADIQELMGEDGVYATQHGKSVTGSIINYSFILGYCMALRDTW